VNLLDAALLGVVQGLTEFLPVSSSGHLILARAFFGWDAGRYGLAFDVACHVGTLLAIVVYFHRDLVAMARGALGALTFREGEAERLVRLILVGTLPAVAVVLVFGDAIEALRDPKIVAVALAVGGVGLLMAERLGTHNRDENTIGYWEALALGAAQAAALVPGVSRSGATLTVALLLGLKRPGAARFVFLMSLPAVLAAAAKETLDAFDIGAPALPAWLFAIGLVVSAVVGYLTIKFFIKYLAKHSLMVFAIYRFALAAVAAVWLMS
jgi:undecaprenyl-diphosphatase